VKRQGGLPLLTAYPLVDASTAAASFGQWLGWWAIVTGVGLVACRFFWTAEILTTIRTWYAMFGSGPRQLGRREHILASPQQPS
jgi:hypothetical protein